jgi:probable blue pigment (indigoidine) exporter
MSIEHTEGITASSERARFITYAVLSSVISSGATLFKVQGVRTVPPLLAAAVGVLFGGVLALLILAASRRLPTWVALWKVRIPLLQLTASRALFSNLIFTVGLSYTTGVEAVFLTKMEPYLVIFWCWLLDKQRPSGDHLALLLLHVAGAFLLSVGDAGIGGGISWFGDLLIVSAVVTAALSYRFAPQVTKVLTPFQTAAVVETLGGLVSLPFALLFCPLQFGPEQQIGWLYVGAHSVLFYMVAIVLLYASLGGIEGWLSSALRATGPLVAAPVAFLFFGESLTGLQLVGAGIVLVTSALISKDKRRGKPVIARVS